MSSENAYRLGKLIVIGMAVQLMVIGYVFYQGHQGRATIVKAQRAGCERSKLDRRANSRGWRNAQEARLLAKQYVIAREYGDIASELEARSRIKCSDVIKKASLIP